MGFWDRVGLWGTTVLFRYVLGLNPSFWRWRGGPRCDHSRRRLTGAGGSAGIVEEDLDIFGVFLLLPPPHFTALYY